MEATLTCAVCLSLFEDPVTLPVCSHNFCRTCVVACLRRARSPAEQAPSSSSRTPRHGHERPRRHEEEEEAEQGDSAPQSGDVVSVCCPLCRKTCTLPGRRRAAAAAALQVNTTLAEVVKLFKASHGAKPGGEVGELAWGHTLGARLAGQEEAPCEKHPGRLLQLFCRMCCRPACEQCVSEEHQGIFHSVNLLGAVYQEEKLNFFSYLKEIRKIHEQLVKEVAAFQHDIETQKLEEEKIINREFGNIYKTLEMKKKQLLESLESQKERRAKEYEIWKKMKDACRKTIEKYLNECEKIVNECDPQHFLEVACNLNHRIKTQIDLIEMSSHYEHFPGNKQMYMDTTSVVHSIFALHLTSVNLEAFKDVPSRDGKCVVFGETDKKSKEQKKIQNAFKPVAGIDVLPDGRMIHTQVMSISEAPDFGEMSHEEVRYNYYMTHQVHSDDLKEQTFAFPLNGRDIFPESPSSSNQPPGASLFSFNAKASNFKLKPQVLQRQDVSETCFSKSVGYLFNTPAVNLNFSGSNNSFSLFNMKGSQKDSQKTSLLENTDPLLTTAQIPQAEAATLSFQTSLAGSPDLLQAAAPSVALLNQCSSGCVTEHKALAVFSSSSGKVSTPSFKNENSVFCMVLQEKPESQNSSVNHINRYNCPAPTVVSFSTTTSPKLDSADSKKTFFSAFPTTSERGLSLPNKQQSSFSLSPSIQNKNQENELYCEHKENNLVNSSVKKLTGNCNLTDSLPCKTCCCVPEEAGASENRSAHGKVSANYFWQTNTVPVFSFRGSVKNNWGARTSSMMSADNTKNLSDKPKMESKNSTVKKSSPLSSSKDLRTLMHSSSFFFMEKLKSEMEIVPQEDAAHICAANKASISGNLTEQNSQSENPRRNEETKEDHMQSHSLRNGASCLVNAESDGEHLHEASNSSESRTLSVADNKIFPR